ncbi:MAG: DUF1080 domain-containing protein [Verrucomicrobia bacterium]|nr:DUF1080 domain-containing protein [Verrucomicrobiota bacterium]
MKTLLKFCLVASAALFFVAGSQSALGGEKSGWTVLFDGTSTAAFRGFKQDSVSPNSWVIDNGTLKSLPAKQVDLITREKYENFELELEWKVAKEANSGIMFHVSEDEPETYRTGPEMQIVDDANTSDGKNPKTSTGSLYALIAPTNKKCNPAGEWNNVRLIVQGNHVEHWMNGAKILEYELGSDTLKALIANSKFKAWPKFAQEKTGHIALQNHGGSVWFRNVRVRRL